MLTLDASKTALVVIDLQEGILPFAGGPHTADDVVSRAARLAETCRASGAPVVMVRVGWSADYAEALKQPIDAQAPARALPENWWTYPAALGKRDSDIEVTKRQWGGILRYRSRAAAPPSRHRHHHPVRHFHQHRRGVYRPQRVGAGL